MRHAKSSWDFPELNDHQRPLNDRGRRDAPRMGRLLKNEKLIPDLIICSDAVRAKTTARIVAEELKFKEKVVETHDLYGSGEEGYRNVICQVPNLIGTLLIVGHNTTLEDLIYALKGEDVRFPTAALAHFECAIEDWKDFTLEIKSKCVRIYKPKELPQDL